MRGRIISIDSITMSRAEPPGLDLEFRVDTGYMYTILINS